MLTISAFLARALLFFLSFGGLCALFRARFGLDRCVAPLAAASAAIVFLMAAGMLGALRPGALLLHALGLCGLLYAFAVRKLRPSWGAILAGALLFAYLCWRFLAARMMSSDDFSHWGLVARHLLLHDRFPNAGDDLITFTSYPLGTACFIYYAGTILGNAEGVYLLAQNLLQAAALLPLFALARRRALLPAVGALFLVFFCYCCADVNLQVDMLLAHFGIGMFAAALCYRREPGRACAAVLPAILAAALIKNSGVFFSLCAALTLLPILRRDGRRLLPRALALLAAPLLAYGAWLVYIRLRLPAAPGSYHAFSPSGYATHLAALPADAIAQIARGMAAHLFSVRPRQKYVLALALLCVPALLTGSAKLPAAARRKYRRCLAAAAAAYLAWYFLIFCMYLFSMSEAEARGLASLGRYDATGYTYACGAVIALTLTLCDRPDTFPTLRGRAARLLPAGALALALIAALLPGAPTALSALVARDTALPAPRPALQQLREEYDLPPGGSYLVYLSRGDNPGLAYDVAKYELESRPLRVITRSATDPGGFDISEGYENLVTVADLAPALAPLLQQADALLMLDEDEAFEAQLSAALEAAACDTPVYRATALP